MENNYVKIMGLKFDALDGIDIVQEANRRNIVEAANFAEKYDDHNTLWLVVPCSIAINETSRD